MRWIRKGIGIAMDERVTKGIVRVTALLLFAAAIILIVAGQRNIGVTGILTMFAGLLILIVLLYFYNRKYR